MTPREELVALRRLAELEAKAAGTSSSQPASAPVPATTAERALGSVPGRFALGAAETVVGGPLQLGANVGSYLNRNVAAPIYDALGMEDSARYAREPRYDVGAIANKAQSDIQKRSARAWLRTASPASMLQALWGASRAASARCAILRCRHRSGAAFCKAPGQERDLGLPRQ